MITNLPWPISTRLNYYSMTKPGEGDTTTEFKSVLSHQMGWCAISPDSKIYFKYSMRVYILGGYIF